MTRPVVVLIAGSLALSGCGDAARQDGPAATTLKPLRWLAGTWRGTEDGQAPFFEEYEFKSDSLLVIRYYADAAATVVADSGSVYVRDNTILHEVGGGIWRAVEVDGLSARFEPHERVGNWFTWVREGPDSWVATLGAPGNQPTVYRLERHYPTAVRLRLHVSTLAHDSLKGRNAGYRGEALAADYVAAECQRIGLQPILRDPRGNPSYFQVFDFTPRRAPERGVYVPQPPDMRSQNVMAILPGTDLSRTTTYIVVSAHHDGQGIEGQTDPGRLPLDAETRRRSEGIWNSADDDASGVAVLLEVAERLAGRGSRPATSILFVSFGAEEHGLFGYRWLIDSTLPGPGGGGAEYYARNPAVPLSSHVAVLDLEMLGRNPTNDPELYVPRGGSWPEAAQLATARTGLRVRVVHRVEQCCNHIAFHRRGIPAALLGVPGNREHYHHPDDEAEHIDYDRLARIARWVEAFLEALAAGGP